MRHNRRRQARFDAVSMLENDVLKTTGCRHDFGPRPIFPEKRSRKSPLCYLSNLCLPKSLNSQKAKSKIKPIAAVKNDFMGQVPLRKWIKGREINSFSLGIIFFRANLYMFVDNKRMNELNEEEAGYPAQRH